MARHQREERPVSDEEFAAMPDRIGDHFDRVREALAEELDDE